MPMISRPSIVPRDVVARASLALGERPLASAQLTDGSWLIATKVALYRSSSDDAGPQTAEWRREWVDVDRASLDPDGRTLTIRWVDGSGEETYPLDRSVTRSFTRTIHERVTASVVASRELSLDGGTARVAVRRRPDGSLFSHVVAIGDLDLADPETSRRIDETEAELRDACGLA